MSCSALSVKPGSISYGMTPSGQRCSSSTGARSRLSGHAPVRGLRQALPSIFCDHLLDRPQDHVTAMNGQPVDDLVAQLSPTVEGDPAANNRSVLGDPARASCSRSTGRTLSASRRHQSQHTEQHQNQAGCGPLPGRDRGCFPAAGADARLAGNASRLLAQRRTCPFGGQRDYLQRMAVSCLHGNISGHRGGRRRRVLQSEAGSRIAGGVIA